MLLVLTQRQCARRRRPGAGRPDGPLRARRARAQHRRGALLRLAGRLRGRRDVRAGPRRRRAGPRASMIRSSWRNMTSTPPGLDAGNPDAIDGGMAADSAVGDFEPLSPTRRCRSTRPIPRPMQNHAPMEPHATMAAWEGDEVDRPYVGQMLNQGQQGIARTSKFAERECPRRSARSCRRRLRRQIAYYVDATLAAIAHAQLKRPVKMAMTRQQIFHTTTPSLRNEQRVRLGADSRRPADRLSARMRLVQCARFENSPSRSAALQPACSTPHLTG